MKKDEFAFLNQQLAAMLRSGLPLERSLRRLAANLHDGALKDDLGRIEGALEKGEPIGAALDSSRLPELYRRMVRMAVKGSDLPGVLTLLADYYQRLHALRTRLQGVLIYPCLVLIGCIALSCFLTFGAYHISGAFAEVQEDWTVREVGGVRLVVLVWLPFLTLSGLGVAMLLGLSIPGFRHWLRWRLPGFREGALAQLASGLSVMLRGGTPLPEAVAFSAELEPSREVRQELVAWEKQLQEGHSNFADLARQRSIFPPLFFWLVEDSGEDIGKGFSRAADIYHARSQQNAELLLYAVLPVSVLFLGALIIGQVLPLVSIALGQNEIWMFF